MCAEIVEIFRKVFLNILKLRNQKGTTTNWPISKLRGTKESSVSNGHESVNVKYGQEVQQYSKSFPIFYS